MELPFNIRAAFQPIYDLTEERVYAYEALVRGTNGESAGEVLSRVTGETLYKFDQACRVTAIRDAVHAGILETSARLSINFMPNAVYSPMACIKLTLATAANVGLPRDRLIFEFTENEKLDADHVGRIVDTYNKLGFSTAIDDFGAGYSSLNLLANLNADIVKIDMGLIRGIDRTEPRRLIVQAMTRLCTDMGRIVVAEGIETQAELNAVRRCGIRYVQGYYIAYPELGSLPVVTPHREWRLAS